MEDIGLMALLLPQSPPEPKGVTMVVDMMRATERYENPRPKMTPEERVLREAARKIDELKRRKVRRDAARAARPPRAKTVPANAKLVGEILAEVIRLRKDGVRFSTLARQFKVHETTIRRAVRES